MPWRPIRSRNVKIKKNKIKNNSLFHAVIAWIKFPWQSIARGVLSDSETLPWALGTYQN